MRAKSDPTHPETDQTGSRGPASSSVTDGPAPQGLTRRRRGAIAGVLVVVVAGAVALVTTQPWHTGPPAGPSAESAETYFLDHYELSTGEVVRTDQGGDTVSEGQAYAMLVAVAVADRKRFSRAWAWERTHLQVASGLFAWRWANGAVADPMPAADADIVTAWALDLAGHRFGDPSLIRASVTVARAVVAVETTDVGGKTALVAGPWAVATSTVDPSYVMPLAESTLAGVTSASAWRVLETSGESELAQLIGDGTLPPEWAILDSTGAAHPAAPPSGGAVEYGYDAVRVPMWLASSCDPADRRLAALLWKPLGRDVAGHLALVDLSLGDTPAQGASDGPVGMVAAAAAADAADHPTEASSLLAKATSDNEEHPTYYASALTALETALLRSTSLGSCAIGA
jgi:endoglucanase